ncbi:MAG: hypothetical protein NT175_00040 [Bacteroidetes bacterium]|nr:hypothetical protein [Bacteroidota bacterium]
MNKILGLKLGWLFFIYIIIDILCAGAGMGVPIFCILFGFLTGWGIIRILLLRTNDFNEILKKSIKYGIITTLITFLLMLIIWGIAIMLFFNQNYDFKNFGHPLILYDPKLSFIGWLVLMILISPLLQLLTTIFSFYMTLIIIKKKDNTA